jgi:hypothetical protein
MTEKFNLWEYSDLKHPGTIEATKSQYHGFATDSMQHMGNVELDMKEIRWGSGGLPIFPLKIFGELEKLCHGKSESSRGAIHLVTVNDFPFGYVIGEQDELSFDDGSLVLNGRQRIPFYSKERRILESMGVFKSGDELTVGYKGVRGEIEGHNSTLKPKVASKYCFSNVCIRDYFSF